MHLPGYSFKSTDGRIERRLSHMLKEENISPKRFLYRDQELSVEGGFRQLLIRKISYSDDHGVKSNTKVHDHFAARINET